MEITKLIESVLRTKGEFDLLIQSVAFSKSFAIFAWLQELESLTLHLTWKEGLKLKYESRIAQIDTKKDIWGRKKAEGESRTILG